MWHLEKVTSRIRIHYLTSAWEATGLPPPPWTPCPLPSCGGQAGQGDEALGGCVGDLGSVRAVPTVRVLVSHIDVPALPSAFIIPPAVGQEKFQGCAAGQTWAAKPALLDAEGLGGFPLLPPASAPSLFPFKQELALVVPLV